MADWIDPDDPDADDDYFSELIDGADETGLEPKFVRHAPLDNDPEAMSKLKVDELITLYIQARNQLATDRKGYKAREARMKTHMSIISMLLRDKGDMAGVDSFRTAAGTAYRNVKEKFTIPNWTAFCDYLKRTGNYQALQKRTSPNAIKEIRTAEGALPDGIESLVEVEFAVRSPTARASKN